MALVVSPSPELYVNEKDEGTTTLVLLDDVVTSRVLPFDVVAKLVPLPLFKSMKAACEN